MLELVFNDLIERGDIKNWLCFCFLVCCGVLRNTLILHNKCIFRVSHCVSKRNLFSLLQCEIPV